MAEAKFSIIFHHQRGDTGRLPAAPHIILGVFESRAGFFTEDFCQVFVVVFELLLTAQRQARSLGHWVVFPALERLCGARYRQLLLVVGGLRGTGR
nr:hypothetical protein [Microbulbifer hainanensis]